MTHPLIALGIAVTILAHQAAGQVEQPRATDTRLRFEQTLSIRTADNPSQPLRVILRDWVIRNRQRVNVTTTGMLVIQMRAGDTMTMTVNGQSTVRKDTEYFTVPAGAALTIETGDDTAVLTVLEVQR